jgi:hypothetical protein
MLKEFRDFAMKGNVVDLAVGVIIGAAFGAIVTSLVGDIIMPIIGAITGGLDFSNYFTGLSKRSPSTIWRMPRSRARCWLGQFPDADDQLPHHRLCAVHGDPFHEPAEAKGRAALPPRRRNRPADRERASQPRSAISSRRLDVAEKNERPIKVVAENRKARFNYAIEDTSRRALR